jgi:hypothetical protein
MASSCLFASRNWLKLDSESRCNASELLNILKQIVGYSPNLYHVKELLIYTNVQLHTTWKFKLLLILMTTSVISIRNIQSYVRLSCVLSWEHCFHAFGSASVIAFWSPGRSPHSIRNKRTKRPGRGTMGLGAAALSSWPSNSAESWYFAALCSTAKNFHGAKWQASLHRAHAPPFQIYRSREGQHVITHHVIQEEMCRRVKGKPLPWDLVGIWNAHRLLDRLTVSRYSIT